MLGLKQASRISLIEWQTFGPSVTEKSFYMVSWLQTTFIVNNIRIINEKNNSKETRRRVLSKKYFKSVSYVSFGSAAKHSNPTQFPPSSGHIIKMNVFNSSFMALKHVVCVLKIFYTCQIFSVAVFMLWTNYKRLFW